MAEPLRCWIVFAEDGKTPVSMLNEEVAEWFREQGFRVEAMVPAEAVRPLVAIATLIEEQALPSGEILGDLRDALRALPAWLRASSSSPQVEHLDE